MINQDKIFYSVKFTKNEIYLFVFLTQKLYIYVIIIVIHRYYYLTARTRRVSEIQKIPCRKKVNARSNQPQFGRKHRLVILASVVRKDNE